MKSFATFYPQSRPLPASSACAMDTCTLRMSVDAGSVTSLRQLAMRVCGDAFEFMRIAMCAGGARIEVWLCVRESFAQLLSDTIVRQLPGARLSEKPGAPGALA